MSAIQTDDLTISQAARVIELSSRRVIQLCEEGRLPHVRTPYGRLSHARRRGVRRVPSQAVARRAPVVVSPHTAADAP
jgi:hypothetical protein